MKYIRIFLLLSFSLFFLQFSFADTLQNIMQQKKIRVGTTGDYQPLTWYNSKTNRYEGLDIDLANNLAKYFNVKIEFVKTTWPTLEQDLQENKFDIAMGGISITPARKQKFIFTKPLFYDKKVVVLRCADSSKYKKIEDINQSTVRVMENAGGTNEKFARQYLTQTRLMIVPHPIGMFDKLLNHQADIIVTDRVEAMFQHKQHPELCMFSLNKTITPLVPKAMMMRKSDLLLQQKINGWLNQTNSSGQLKQEFTKWGL